MKLWFNNGNQYEQYDDSVRTSLLYIQLNLYNIVSRIQLL